MQALGRMLREWRAVRHQSQLALALKADVSQRHLSFVESGRAKPSRELVLKIAAALDELGEPGKYEALFARCASLYERLGEILSRLFTARGWGRQQGRLQLERAWSEVVGEQHATHTKPGALRRGVLEVIVDNAVLLQELAHYHKRRLLEQLRRRLPNTPLTDLRFRAGVIE